MCLFVFGFFFGYFLMFFFFVFLFVFFLLFKYHRADHTRKSRRSPVHICQRSLEMEEKERRKISSKRRGKKINSQSHRVTSHASQWNITDMKNVILINLHTFA